MLTLIRDAYTARSTHGRLYWKGDFVCYTLEDTVRPYGVKVYGQTAIASGLYNVVVSRSNRFQCDLPEILDVPQFTGVRMHGGNTHENTEGCILVAHNRDLAGDKIWGKATEDVLTILRGVGGRSWIEVRNLYQNG